MTDVNLVQEAFRLSKLVDAGILTGRDSVVKLADAENAYRKAKAQAWVTCPIDPADVPRGEREWTAARREAWVNAETADLRRERDIAEGMKRAAEEAVRARRTQLSVIQTILNLERAEAEFTRTGPQGIAA